MKKEQIKKNTKNELKTSWAKIIIAIIFGVVLGYLILGQGWKILSYESILPLVTLALLACILALLLDIRKIILSKICP
jgi:biotin transporter BioY